MTRAHRGRGRGPCRGPHWRSPVGPSARPAAAGEYGRSGGGRRQIKMHSTQNLERETMEHGNHEFPTTYSTAGLPCAQRAFVIEVSLQCGR